MTTRLVMTKRGGRVVAALGTLGFVGVFVLTGILEAAL